MRIVRQIIILLLASSCFAQTIQQYEVGTITLPAAVSGYDYLDIDPAVAANNTRITVTGDSAEALTKSFSIVIEPFWDGGTTWKFKFNPPYVGRYSYSVSSPDANLNNASGTIRCLTERTTKRGRIKVGNNGRFGFYIFGDEPEWMLFDTLWNGNFSNSGVTNAERWSAFQDRGNANWTGYIMRLGEAGQMTKTLDGNLPFKNDGTNKYDLDSLVVGYWQSMDAIFDSMAVHDLNNIIGAIFTQDSPAGIYSDYTATQRQRWFRYIINRYGAYFIIWCGVYQYNGIGSLSDWQGSYNYFLNNDPWDNPTTLHPDGAVADQALDESVYADITGSQYFGFHYEMWDSLQFFLSQEGQPFVNLEHGYSTSSAATSNEQPPTEVLDDAMVLAAFSAGVGYGHADIWLDLVTDSLSSVSADYMENLWKFMNSKTSLKNMGWRFWETDTRTKINNDRYENKKNGRHHVVFVINDTGPFTIDLSHFLATDKLIGHWYNVENGTWGNDINPTNSAAFSINAPGNHQILLVKKDSRFKPQVVTSITK